tara:strand:- start:204 stop:488 length:285 start_codon:yes stop_codon:yes gene_type:complete
MKFLVDEEYGYRHWVWETGKSRKEMVAWWSSLETVDPFFFNPASSLPFGKIYPLPEDCQDIPEVLGYFHLHEDYDSFMKIEGENYYHKGHKPLE